MSGALKGLQWKDVTASADPAVPNGKNGWYTSPITVTLSPAEIAEYSLDGGVTWAVYGAPVTLDTDGTHQVQYRRSVDSGEVKNLEINIHRTAPVVQITGAASYTIDQTVDHYMQRDRCRFERIRYAVRDTADSSEGVHTACWPEYGIGYGRGYGGQSNDGYPYVYGIGHD